jgi:CheY-like chemotaxis protein
VHCGSLVDAPGSANRSRDDNRGQSRIMEQSKNPNTLILVADDDPDDRLLVKRVLEDTGFAGNLQFVSDGEELMEYLRYSKSQRSTETSLRPDLILLDLHMPKKDGREALRDIKQDPVLNDIIIVALNGSEIQNESEICSPRSKCLMSKPDSYTGWVQMMGKVLGLLTESKSKME